ncbi:DUF1501 domain-containing protein [Thiorhodococcus mannitoliphagus]|uniref:DUF1501 domain-containing protein n=1 Tax=Thiorhodococcus mannitoliphagus TaxID=329406 RepID=A0A6P1DYP0_9GAMM|nr:DUF1501 domain-containing protein [Thiorhodococcus mannitoliphagus]NEX22600.1 DUF1501 domain-containing protein [Thiorhodococcus mannitoliphagus]
MKRRTFLRTGLALGTLGCLPSALSQAARPSDARLLILIALKGGNDGFNTLIPYADPRYSELRPELAIDRDQVVKLSEQEGLHPQLAPLLSLWEARELAIIRGLGYPDPNLSHFRSMDIWETASSSDEVLTSGWLDRACVAAPRPADASIDAIVVGGDDAGSLMGGQARVITLANLGQFRRQAQRLGVPPSTLPAQPALRHVVEVENSIRRAADQMKRGPVLQTAFPDDALGRSVRTACEVIASRERTGLRVVHLSLGGFDTHIRQAPTQARLFKSLAAGLPSLRAGLKELGVWNDSLILTYSEFGRRPRQNANGGTDHGTASVQFALGGRVKGGFQGAAPNLADLDGNGNPRFTLDFRGLYATVLERWWGIESQAVLGGRFSTLSML